MTPSEHAAAIIEMARAIGEDGCDCIPDADRRPARVCAAHGALVRLAVATAPVDKIVSVGSAEAVAVIGAARALVEAWEGTFTPLPVSPAADLIAAVTALEEM
ncbi:hypothetical protein [Pseudonocardia pini]|uniref:hypothetical protein n=1 Tax=Pseudonocardia pini TaxID=2758030 RepID=UPI0015F0266C|nr:hypothetical protein [Pseudonocardia pini]